MKRLMGIKFVLPIILLLAFGLVALSGLAQAAGTYMAGDNGKTITVNNGDTFTVRLDENPTTGYSWNMTVGSGLQVVSDRYVPNATSAHLVGSGGYHEWTIKAVKNGTYKVSGIYKRPWEPIRGDEQKYTLTVNVVTGGAQMPSLMPSAFNFKFSVPGFKPANMSGFGNIFNHFPRLGPFGLH